MKHTGTLLLTLATVYGVVGLGAGVAQAAGLDLHVTTTQSNLHVVGWLSVVLYGVYYRFFPELACSPLGRLHCGVTVVAMLTLLAGSALSVLERSGDQALLLGGALLCLISLLTFLALLLQAPTSGT